MAMTAKQVRQALTRLKKARATRSSIAVLSTVRIDASGMHATDMKAHLTIHAETGIDSPVQVDPVQLAGALKGLKASDAVRFESVPGAFGVRVNGITLAGVDPADWPLDTREGLNPRVSAPAGLFDAMLDVAVAAVSRDESRPVLTGVQVVFTPESVRVSATDSYRLARVILPAHSDMADPLEVTLPVDGGKYLKAIGGISGVGFVDASGSIGAFVDLYSEDATLTLRRIEGQYPNVDMLIPDAWESSGMTTGLLPVVDRIAAIVGKNNPMELHLESGEVSAAYADYDSIVEPVTIPGSWDGEDMTMGVNARYLQAGLRFVGDAESMRMISPLRPILLGCKYDRCYLVMPVRLGKTVRERMEEAAAGEQVPA